MKYFINLPKTSYNGNGIRDIFKKVVKVEEGNSDIYINYRISEGETLHDISLKIYGSVEYWWVLAVLNEIEDVHYDLPLPSDVMNKVAKDTQTIRLPDRETYILFPQVTDIYSVVGGNTVSGQVVRKYEASGAYNLEVRLDDPDYNFPTSVTLVSLTSERLCTVSLSGIAGFNVGDIVRQDYLNSDNEPEDFARGYVIKKATPLLYLYKTSDNRFYQSGTTFSVSDIGITYSEVVTASLFFAYNETSTLSRSILDSSTIISSLPVTISPSEYLTLSLERYDDVENENNSKRTLKVLKPEYLQTTINTLLSQIED